MVIVTVPWVATALAVSVSVDNVPVVGFPTNTAVTPVGRFSAVSVTGIMNSVRARPTLVAPLAPRAIVRAAGLVESVTPSAGVTVSTNVAT